jgi:hypothetical protein
VWDIASVAAGVVSFGTATVAMAGAKAGVRGLLKAGGKVAVGLAKKQMERLAAKSLALKAGLKNIRPFLAKIPRICVTACFPAGTPVAVEGGYKNIEELQVGELVWAWHEETGDLALKPVLQTMQRESDALVELQVGADTVQATPEHPFWANGAWTDAGDLAKGDELLRSDGLTMPVGQVTHRTEQATTVYNVEVADWHTYLVSWWMFVVHNTTICLAEIKKLLLARRYLRQVEQITGMTVHPKQLVEIRNALKTKKYTKLSAAQTAKSRKRFKRVKNKLIKEWEQQTGRTWPKYDKQVLDKNGDVFREIGDPYDAHHLIENTYGGDHKWWNIHPASSPTQHQGGIHGADGLAKLLFD